MKREQLKELGITDDEIINGIMKLHGKSIEDHKTKLQDAESNVANLTKQVEDANAAITNLKSMGDVEEMKKSIGELETTLATTKQEYEQSLAKVHFDYDLDGILKGAKAKDAKLVRALLDETLLKHDPEKHTFEGLDEQLNSKRETHGYLFEGDQETMTIVKGGNNKTVIGKSDAVLRQAAGLPVQE